jgi:prevent-host-death family protein
VRILPNQKSLGPLRLAPAPPSRRKANLGLADSLVPSRCAVACLNCGGAARATAAVTSLTRVPRPSGRPQLTEVLRDAPTAATVWSARPAQSQMMSPRQAEPASGPRDTNHWQLQDAKARFSEVVRRAAECGPQHVTVNGQERAVVISAEEYVRLRGQPTGRILVDLMAGSPLADITLEHAKVGGPVRDVNP